MAVQTKKLWRDEAAQGLALPLGPGYLLTGDMDFTDMSADAIWDGVSAGTLGTRLARGLSGRLEVETRWTDLSGGARPLDVESLARDGLRVRLQVTVDQPTVALLAHCLPGTSVTANDACTDWQESDSAAGDIPLPALLWVGRTPFGLALIRLSHAWLSQPLALPFGKKPGEGIPCSFVALQAEDEMAWQVRWMEDKEDLNG